MGRVPSSRRDEGSSFKKRPRSEAPIDLGGSAWPQDEGDSDNDGRHGAYHQSRRGHKAIRDDDVDSVDDFSTDRDDDDEEMDKNEHAETLDEKKVRLAREYLRRIDKVDENEESSSASDDDDESHDERIRRRLRHERQKQAGTLERMLAQKVKIGLESMRQAIVVPDQISTDSSLTTGELEARAWRDAGHVHLLRGHDLTVTSVSLTNDGATAVSGSKDHSVLLWDVEHQKRISTLSPRWDSSKSALSKKKAGSRSNGEVLSVACSDNGKFAAVGRKDASVSIFDLRMALKLPVGTISTVQNPVHTFTGHKGPVTGLAFRSRTLELFSASEDRCIRHYNLDEMLYLETLYGHQFGVSSIDCYNADRPVSVGKDRTARAWKLADDTHLIFRGGAKTHSAECVAMLYNDWFVTGHQDGQLALWNTEKKKSVASVECAHGTTVLDDTAKTVIGNEILSVSCCRSSDLVATGSRDGYLRLWEARTGKTLEDRGLEPVGSVPLHGYINDIAMGPRGRFCAVATGQDHRYGRFGRVPRGLNRFVIVSLRPQSSMSSNASGEHGSSGDDQANASSPASESDEADSSDSQE
jgi:ribosomal RNA-processing protein 9